MNPVRVSNVGQPRQQLGTPTNATSGQSSTQFANNHYQGVSQPQAGGNNVNGILQASDQPVAQTITGLAHPSGTGNVASLASSQSIPATNRTTQQRLTKTKHPTAINRHHQAAHVRRSGLGEHAVSFGVAGATGLLFLAHLGRQLRKKHHKR
ncbi:hypothetical protein M8332_02150 [Fructilactobacillus ixorae]|uniref:Gram-positive cocci surface proteins LPxTG domain-containing protein n=1 Tax=Fructilactobacillus ixorae TaxID=1750535 RepID=A0ABY5C6J0_9LACO|nr:hypothetical protein [Fructilactobacillus ixorae]USS93674.1 hypothetical protein M8332_02150 [Fructilactobacillus ixorae]